MSLLRTELLRARSRRSVLALLLAGFLLTIGLGAAAAWDARPYSADETAQAETRAQKEFDRCERQVEKRKDSSRQCKMRVHTWQYDRWRDPLDDQRVEGHTVTLAVGLMLVGALMGASFVGGEYSSGSMSNLLVFESRRTRVWLAKLSAIGLVGILWAAVCFGAYVAGLVALGRSWDLDAWPPNWIGAMSWLGVRGAIVAAAGAVIGAALTLAVRSTTAAIGVVFGYVLLVEGVARIAFGAPIIEYALSSRILGVLHGSYRTETTQLETIRVTLQDSAIMLLGVSIVLCAISLVTFRRRDID